MSTELLRALFWIGLGYLLGEIGWRIFHGGAQ